MKAEWAVGSPPDTMIRMTENGWITSETFSEWAESFCKFVVSDGKPHLLLLDGHGSRTFNMTFLELMASNNIHVMSFPSHTTHVLQPADKSLFKSFKAHWSTEGLRNLVLTRYWPVNDYAITPPDSSVTAYSEL